MTPTKYLRCPSCGRENSPGPNHVETFSYEGRTWCTECAAIKTLEKGLKFVLPPSPGVMVEDPSEDSLAAFYDCYSYTPKKRIRVGDAEAEVQRAWEEWDGDKSSGGTSMLRFFQWLQEHRPYFLTFRTRGDPWQQVKSWLIQHEQAHRRSERT